jgi:L-fuconate dehydratase
VIRIARLEAADIRFPTSKTFDGSDAMNSDPDYSAAVCVLKTNVDGLEGHGLAFTLGRGNEICVAAIEALAPLVVGLSLEQIQSDMAGFWRRIVGDTQMRWLGPEKGVVHLAAAAVINAVWDLWARAAGQPVWRLVADMSPEQVVALIDFRHIEDALSPEEARDLLRDQRADRAGRIETLVRNGLPAYTTSPGWIGYDDAKLRRLCREAAGEGWSGVKLKVGKDGARNLERCFIAREARAGRRLVDRGAGQSRRRARPSRGCTGRSPDQGRHRRALQQPCDVQTIPPGRRHRRRAGRRLPPGRSQ